MLGRHLPLPLVLFLRLRTYDPQESTKCYVHISLPHISFCCILAVGKDCSHVSGDKLRPVKCLNVYDLSHSSI